MSGATRLMQGRRPARDRLDGRQPHRLMERDETGKLSKFLALLEACGLGIAAPGGPWGQKGGTRALRGGLGLAKSRKLPAGTLRPNLSAASGVGSRSAASSGILMTKPCHVESHGAAAALVLVSASPLKER